MGDAADGVDAYTAHVIGKCDAFCVYCGCEHPRVVYNGPRVVACQDCGEPLTLGGPDCTIEEVG